MTNQEILDNAPNWADAHRKLLDYPDCTTYANNADDEQVLDRSLADIKRIVELEEERRDDYSEASTYATSLFNTYYKSKPDAVNFELCTSVAAIITQIDNMATGVISELEKELSDSQTQGDRALSVRDLRQQAKGVEDFFKSHKPRISMGKSAIWEVDDVLVDEALAALKEQVK